MTSPNIDLTALAYDAMLAKNFLPDFTPQIEQQLATITSKTFPLDSKTRDLRHLLWFSIDNDDSRDLDQLTYAEKLSEKEYKIYIAVALVDLLVKSHTPIDGHAAHNTTSVYTPTKIFHMLPEKLSTDLTSLNPEQNRFALVFEGIVSEEGNIEHYDVYSAYVHNYAQLAYNSVGSWLESKSPIPPAVANVSGLADQIRLQDTISSLLSEARHKHGALSVETIEAQPEISHGIPIAIHQIFKNRARTLIENFMIAANCISARFTKSNQLLALRRVVTVPHRWDKIMFVAQRLGESLPSTPDGPALERFLCKQKKLHPSTFSDLSLTIIKLLGRGEYHVASPGKESAGHFGLALHGYSHSTAPNRRFPDLITQRILLAALAQQPTPYSKEELTLLAAHCTEKEDDAEKIQRRMKKSAAAIVLSSSIGKEFAAIVTGAAPKGTWVRIFNPPVEGKLIKGQANLDVGDRIRVKLVHTDPKAGFIDFARS